MKRFLKEEKGQGLVEYALILVLVAIVVIAILLLMGPVVGNVFSNVVASLNAGSGGGSQQIIFTTVPQITSSGGMGGCVYSAASVQVRVTQDGNPVSGASVGGTVAVWDSDSPPNYITSFSIGGTTGGSGQASLAGSSGSVACGGHQAVVSISGGPSQAVSIP